MSSEQKKSDDNSYYVENLLFNHDIEIQTQFIKDLSFEKKEEYAFFTEEDFKGKTDFSLNIEVVKTWGFKPKVCVEKAILPLSSNAIQSAFVAPLSTIKSI